MDSIFYRDITSKKKVSYKDLIRDINTKEFFSPYCISSDYYTIFKNIIISLLADRKIILLDSDMGADIKSSIAPNSRNYQFEIDINIHDKEHLLSELNQEKENWEISLFTSGTTGQPTKVTHSFKSITRFLKISDANASDIWGFAYNPTHMAGVQVFTQAIYNGNKIVRLFKVPKKKIFEEIDINKITHISATPSFYRLLLPHKEKHESVTRITSGGEKFQDELLEDLRLIFPNAKFTNIYASTEAGTLFAGDNEIFTVKEKIRDLIRIQENELIVHKSLLGKTEKSEGNWYSTGDLVEVVDNKPLRLRFISRKNQIINIGGYKVNPHEIEEVIRKIEGVDEAIVFPKDNSIMGKILCAKVIIVDKELDEASIRSVLREKVQDFKIPRMMQFVDELPKTRTGKIKRE